MAEPADPNLDELKRRGRRRLVGAVVLALVAAVVVPMLLESEPRPLGEDISVRIPPVDDAKPVNRLNAPKARGEAPRADPKVDLPKPDSANPGPGTTPAATAAEPASQAVKAAAAAPEASADTAPRKSIADAEKSVLAQGSRMLPLEPSKAALDAPKSDPAPGAAASASKSTAAAAPALASAPPPATPKDGFVVQLGAFTDDKGASALANRLRKVGHPAYTESLATSRGALWRVRVGPYPTRDAALQARDRLKAEGQAGIVVQAR